MNHTTTTEMEITMKNFVKGKRYWSIPHHRYVYFGGLRTKYNGKSCCDYIFHDICDATLVYSADEVERCIIEK